MYLRSFERWPLVAYTALYEPIGRLIYKWVSPLLRLRNRALLSVATSLVMSKIEWCAAHQINRFGMKVRWNRAIKRLNDKPMDTASRSVPRQLTRLISVGHKNRNTGHQRLLISYAARRSAKYFISKAKEYNWGAMAMRILYGS